MRNETNDDSSQYPADLATLAPQTWREWRDRLPENREDEKLAAMLRYAARTDFVGVRPNDFWEISWGPLRQAVNAEINDGEREPWRSRHWMTVSCRVEESLRNELKASRYAPQSMDDLDDLGPMEYLIAGLLPAGQAFLLYGPRKAGKTFAAIDLGLCIATGRAWHGRAVKAGKVLHVVAEGNRAAIANRVKAWIAVNGKDNADREALATLVSENWRLIGTPVYIDNETALNEFLRVVGEGWALVILDPLLRNMAGDTNAQRDMSAFVAAFDIIRQRTGGAVLVVHHEGKKTERGALGSIALEAAVDGAVTFRHEGNRRVMRIAFLRDAPEEQPALSFELVHVPIDGTIESAALRLAGETTTTTQNPMDRILVAAVDGLSEKTAGLPRRTFYRALSEARQLGLIELDSYSLTDKGHERLNGF